MGALRHTVGKPSPKIPPSHWRDLIPEHADRLAGLPVPCQLPACLPELSLELPPEPAMEGAPSDHLRAMLAATGGFALLFSLADRLSRRYVRVYAGFSRAEKADWCSRVNSTVHAVGIVSGLLYSFEKQRWDEDLYPLRSTALAATLFSVSCGYFLFDLYVLIRWQVPLWRVFVIHHVVAALPYLIYTLHAGCGMDVYLLTLFLLVEFAVIPMNITTFLEQLGYGKTRLHRAFFYTTYVCWFVARVVLPLYNIYVLWTRIIPEAAAAPFCTIPAAMCGHVIAAFCVGVFIFVWTPDVLARWRAPVLQLEEYPDYKLTLRQSMTPRASPLSGGLTLPHYGSTPSKSKDVQWSPKPV